MDWHRVVAGKEDKLRKGEPIDYWNTEGVEVKKFVLPGSAIIFDINIRDSSEQMAGDRRILEPDLREFYWNVTFLDEKKEPEPSSESGKVRWKHILRFTVKNKKTPKDIEMCSYYSEEAHGDNDIMIKKYGEVEFKKFSEHRDRR